MSRYYDRRGQPIGLMKWCEMFENMEYRRIAQTTTPKGRVSTVWLGLDHSFGRGEPLIFETMVFDSGDDEMDMRRYSSEAEAIKGHKEVVEECGGEVPQLQ